MKKFILVAAFAVGFATSAFALDCATMINQIDEAMKTATVDEATMTKVMAFYEQGRAEHEAGDHTAAVNDLGEAMTLLGI
jgi:opacity protein-like surface antigen